MDEILQRFLDHPTPESAEEALLRLMELAQAPGTPTAKDEGLRSTESDQEVESPTAEEERVGSTELAQELESPAAEDEGGVGSTELVQELEPTAVEEEGLHTTEVAQETEPQAAEEVPLPSKEISQTPELPTAQELGPVLLACCQQGVLDGDGLELLPAPLVGPLFDLCAEQIETTRGFLESQLAGPHRERASAVLNAEIKADEFSGQHYDWQDELTALHARWQKFRLESIDLEPLFQPLRESLIKALASEAFTLPLRRRTLRDFSFDLSQPAQREMEALLWNAETQEAILRRVAQTFAGKGSPKDRGALLSWALKKGSQQTLQQLAKVLPQEEISELVKRLQAMERSQEAADTLYWWLDRELPINPKKLTVILNVVKKTWDLRQQRPDLPQLFVTNATRALLKMTEKPRKQLLHLVKTIFDVREIWEPLEESLLQSLATATLSRSDQSVLITLLLELYSDNQAILHACEWSRTLPQLTAAFWVRSLKGRPLPSSGDLTTLLLVLLQAHKDLLVILFEDRLEVNRADLSAWFSKQVESLGQQLNSQWHGLRQLLLGLEKAWQDNPGLLARVGQVDDALEVPPTLQELCPILFETLPSAPEVASTTCIDELPSLHYLAEHWSSWTSLVAPDFPDLNGWLATSHDRNTLADLVFDMLTAVLDGVCPDSVHGEVRHFVDRLAERRPDVAEYLRENFGDALQLLPFPTLLLASATPAVATEDLPAMARRLEALQALKSRAQQQIEQLPLQIRLNVARRLGPSLDNLEQFLLPYFLFRRKLEQDFGLETAVAGLNQLVSPELLGSRIRVAGQGGSDDVLYANTLGLRLREEERAVWLAYASPRPRQ